MKKVFFILMALMLSLTVISCKKAAGSVTSKVPVTEAGQFPIVKEKVTLTVFAGQQGIVENLNTNYATKWLEEKTNIHLDWNATPAGDARQKVSVLINSGEKLPDVFMVQSMLDYSALSLYGSQGVFPPLNDLIDKYGVETKRIWNFDPEVKKQMTSLDGNIYALGSYSLIKHTQYWARVWINDTWMKKLGLKEPTTTEELYNVLVAFRDRDPNGNGLKDEIPITGANGGSILAFIMNSFTYYGNNRFHVKGGQLEVVPTLSEYREGLRFMNRLWRDNLIDKQLYSQPVEAVRQLLGGEYVRGGIVAETTISNVTDPYGEQTKQFRMMSPVAGPKGVRNMDWNPPTFSASYFVTKDSSNPEAAFRFGDYLMSEEANAVTFQGEKGVDWEDPKPGDMGVNGLPARFKTINSLPSLPMQNKGWMWMAPQVDLSYIIDGSVVDPNDPWYIEIRLYQGATDYLEPYVPSEGWIPPLTYTQEEIRERTPLVNEISSYLSTACMQFVTGELSLDTDWDAFVKQLNDLGIERLRQIDQKALDTYNRK
jgi:putative aldouronate transport system substrate-binding protein